MTLVLAHVTTDPAAAIVLVSELESGGFHPVLFDYHHSFIALGYLQALGGIRIMLPDDEIDRARDYLNLATPTQDCDPMPERPLKDILYASILSINPLFPLYLMPPMILLALTGLFIMARYYLFPQPLIVAVLESSVLLFLVSMLAHAKYVALPKSRESL